jgi:hypothetical protein
MLSLLDKVVLKAHRVFRVPKVQQGLELKAFK